MMKILKKFGALLAPFWLTKAAFTMWLSLISILFLALCTVWIAVLFNNWSKTFYDALADYFEHASVIALAAEYLFYMVLFVLAVVCGNWLKKWLIIHCRHVMTLHFEQRWFTQHNYYHFTLDNPDQRIAEDIRLFIEQSLELLLSFFKNVTRLFSFMFILWEISGKQIISIGDYSFAIHGYLVWIALAYALISSGFAHLFGRKLHLLNIEKQRAEADYRASLLHIRAHKEQIAFYQGEQAEQQFLQKRFSNIIHNWRKLMTQEFKLEGFTTSYFRISLIIPVFVTLPLYITKQITLGQVMQARTAFGYVLDAFGWFIDSYKSLMVWSATVERLWQFHHSTQTNQLNNIENSLSTDDHLICKNLTIFDKGQQPLIENLSFNLQKGEWCVLSGKSGIGKTTLLRTLAGLWFDYHGEKQLPNGKTLFLPQKIYLPHESLREIICYPNQNLIDDKLIIYYLNEVGLGYLATELDSNENWHQRLSGGEQQRLSLIRALIIKPTLLCLDESTNQLDDQAATNLLKRLRELLPNTMVLAITHQKAIITQFDKQIELISP